MYLVLHSTYHTVEVAICSEGVILDAIQIDKYEASSQMTVALAELLSRAHVTSVSISFVGVHAGPGPFTTLRAVLATANGFAFATGTPVVAIDGLRALLTEHYDPAYPVTMALLNAYSGDLYYALQTNEQVTTGIFYGVDALQQMLQQLPSGTIRFIGNGVAIHEKLLHAVCSDRVYIPEPNPETCSLQQVACASFQQWVSQQEIYEQVMPLYLKNY